MGHHQPLEGNTWAPQPGHGAEKSHTAALHPSVVNAERCGVGGSGLPQYLQEGPDTSAVPAVNSSVPWWWTSTTGVAGIFAYVNCNVKVFVPATLASSGGNSNERIRIYLCLLVTSQTAISSPVAMETTRPQHQLAVQYIIYLFFFT